MKKLAIVTGATGGIGRAVSERLWHEGYSLILHGRSREKIGVLCEKLHSTRQDGQVLGSPCFDVLSDSWWRFDTLMHSPEFCGIPLSLLAVCHGAAPVPGPALLALQDLARVWEVDVMGAFAACQVAGECMIQQRHGSIVLISSLHARMTYPQRVAYATAKSAICGMARALAVEWGVHGVRVNAVLPWQVTGERSQRMIDAARERGEDLEEAYLQRCPARKMVQPEEVAETVLWLTRTPSVNGAEIVLDGGVSQSMWYQGFMQEMSQP